MRDAIRCLNYDPDEQLRQPLPSSSAASSSSSSDDLEAMLHGTALRDVLLRGFRSHADSGPTTAHASGGNFFSPNAHLTSWARRYARPDPVVIPGDPDLRARGLNDTQIRAVAIMLGGMAGPVPELISEPSSAY